MKECVSCNKELPLSSFGNNKRMKDGLNQYCRKCAQEKNKNYRQKYLYGLSEQEFFKLLEKQDNRCAICGTHRDVLTRDLHIDHDHETGEVRGLLCISCNTGLGQFRDSKDLLTFAIAYLESSYEGQKTDV